MRKYDKRLFVRCDNTLLSQIKKAASKSKEDTSTYIRKTLSNASNYRNPEAEKAAIETLNNLQQQLSRCGNNLNQVARKLHTHNTVNQEELEQSLTHILEIKKQIARELDKRHQ